jgi:hypothetical protein
VTFTNHRHPYKCHEDLPPILLWHTTKHTQIHSSKPTSISITTDTTTQTHLHATAKMVQCAGIKVSVVRFGGEVLEDENFEDGHVFDFYQEHMLNGETYIKVSTREQFLIHVYIMSDFDFMGIPEAQIYCSIDGE